MRLFRQTETRQEHSKTMSDVLEELQYLRGRVASLETEWADTKDQVRRSYQRLEKAAERRERAEKPCAEPSPGDQPQAGRVDGAPGSRLGQKWADIFGSSS